MVLSDGGWSGRHRRGLERLFECDGVSTRWRFGALVHDSLFLLFGARQDFDPGRVVLLTSWHINRTAHSQGNTYTRLLAGRGIPHEVRGRSSCDNGRS